LPPSNGHSRKDHLPKERVAEIYERCGALVLRRCRLLLGDPAEAQDAMQEVFIRLMRYGSSIREKEVPLSWLYRTAERCCFDRMRKNLREPVGESNEIAESASLPDPGPEREAAEVILRFFRGLPPKFQQVALLHYVDGLSQEQIGASLGWSRRTVGKKIKQLRQRAERLARSWKEA
jgi:RNA polymerase sigma-70 factor, ECF subfamily